MKKNLLFLFLIAATFVGKGQNLVPNGDFEQYLGCPDNLAQIDSLLFWVNPTTNDPGISGTPDYLNQCSTSPLVTIPNYFFGYQLAHSGAAYSGIILYEEPPSPVWREYIEVPLITVLTANICYHFEMYVNLANECAWMTPDIGIYFSNSLISGVTNALPLPYTAQLNNAIVNTFDTLNWTLVGGNYIASGGEAYLIIGNYKSDANTTLFLYNPNIVGFDNLAYVYIDDVCLTPCGSSCFTGIEEQTQNSGIKIYPNPVSDELKVSGLKFKVGDEVKIFDVMGKEVLKSIIRNPKSEMKIDMRSFSKGIYFIKVNTGEREEIKKVIKIE